MRIRRAMWWVRMGACAAFCAALTACRDHASDAVPPTPLGAYAKGWIFAHNRGDGHAMVHFTMRNRGTVTMNGAQIDSTVFDGVQFSKTVGRLVADSIVESSDSVLTLSLRSANGAIWLARFTAAEQPSTVQVRVSVRPLAQR